MNYIQETEDTKYFLLAMQEYQKLNVYNEKLWIKMSIYLTWGKLGLYVEEDTLLIGLWIEE